MAAPVQHIRIDDYSYTLPDGRIAKFPLPRRDDSRLLLYRGGETGETTFKNLPDYLPDGALLVFNNTRVIQARLLFRKETGARIELFCLEPAFPCDYALILQQTSRCRWYCMVGNAKRWKEGTLSLTVAIDGFPIQLNAERKETAGDTSLVEFTWDNPSYTFADLLDAAGQLPIPPYLHRETEESDLKTYQTVYSKIKGSVAAPTAGLHFTPELLSCLDAKGFGREELTLHVGAGTFKPVKSDTIAGHDMHTEFISVTRASIERIKANLGRIIAVGTTSVRTLESLYYTGLILSANPDASPADLIVGQWMPYDAPAAPDLSAAKALDYVLDYLDRRGTNTLVTATRIMIAPGYRFHIVRGMLTNFHQPKSTLLLLIAAFAGEDWRKIYDYALTHDFRFLSYGDSSLLL
ncbi:MAG: S-adenosylmethionine:tRNA ribosyltransferase-isomerase [Tannerellaceae bacterium]|jgi:S-adenosylmethionine:tRNA ribosyltransferase-isomerase|nr:S-adenosylmethionine:tRNA ribosyltransferase-isomerase [Tannerellaceae bacterium]